MKIKNLILGFAIFILTLSVGVYGITSIYGKAPDYNKYCPQIMNEKECVDFGGTWNNYSAPEMNSKPIPGGYCDVYQRCQKDYDSAREKYSEKIFYSALIAGIVILIIGAFAFALEAVGAGLMAGGVGILIYGVVGFWEFADNWIKFILSLIGLGIVIWASYFINKKYKKDKK